MSGYQEARDDEAERGVLGAVLLARNSGEILSAVIEALAPEDFAYPAHGVVYQRILDMFLQGQPVDPITLVSSLIGSGDIERVGGGEYIHTLIRSTTVPEHAPAYAERVARASLLRRFQQVSVRVGQMGRETAPDDVERMIEVANDQLDALRDRRKSSSSSITDILNEVLDDVEHMPERVRYPSGLVDLDRFFRGAGPGKLVIAAGRPAMGKSLLGLKYAITNAVENRVFTRVFSLEMGKPEVGRRLLAAVARVDHDKLIDPKNHPLRDFEWAKIRQAHEKIEGAPLEIHDDAMGLAEIASLARQDARRHGDCLYVVDFLQLMQWPAKAANKAEAIGANAYGLKMTARSTGIGVLALAQLNREVTRRAGGVPELSDLAGSGEIEMAADGVILIDRPETREQDSPRTGEADLIVAKQREGRTGIAVVRFEGHYARFANLAPDGM